MEAVPARAETTAQRRGRLNRSRGNAIERWVCKQLGIKRVGMFGGKADGGDRDDWMAVQVKTHLHEVGGCHRMVWAVARIIGISTGGIKDHDDGERGIASWYVGYYSKGEQVNYAAVGSFRNFHDKPYLVVIINRVNGRKALAWVRDHCTRCYRDGTGKRIVDLSPDVFKALSGGDLGVGLLRVRMVKYERYIDLASSREGRRAWLLR